MKWDLLGGLNEDEQRSVLAASTRRRFRKGDTIIREGDVGDSLHLLAKGKVAVQVTTPMGEIATLAVLSIGQSFGVQALLHGGQRRTASIVALEPVETLALHRDRFDELRHRQPSVERLLTALLAMQVVRLTDRVIEALYCPAETRVLHRIRELIEVYGDGGITVTIPMTQEELATMAGTTRPTANRALQLAVEAGAITLGRGRVTVVDEAALGRLLR